MAADIVEVLSMAPEPDGDAMLDSVIHDPRGKAMGEAMRRRGMLTIQEDIDRLVRLSLLELALANGWRVPDRWG